MTRAAMLLSFASVLVLSLPSSGCKKQEGASSAPQPPPAVAEPSSGDEHTAAASAGPATTAAPAAVRRNEPLGQMPKLSPSTLTVCRQLIALADKQAAAVEPKDSARAVQRVAAAQAEIGDFDGAVVTLKKSAAGADLGHVVYYLSRSLYGLEGLAARVNKSDDVSRKLAEANAQAGRFDQALTLLAGLKTPEFRHDIERMILVEAATRGNAKLADDMLGRIQAELSSKSPPQTVAEFAQFQALCGKLEAARQTLKEIKDASLREQGMGGIAVALATRGDFPQAVAVADEISYFHREMVLYEVITIIAESGRTSDALALVAKLVDDDSRADAIADIASAQARAGQIEAAQATLAQYPKNSRQPTDRPRFEIMKVLLKRGDIVGADSIAHGIEATSDVRSGPTARIEALCCVARARFEKGDPGARPAIDEVLAEIKKPNHDFFSKVQHYALVLWAISPSNDLRRMAEVCESASNDPNERCEIYSKTVHLLVMSEAPD